MSAEPYTHVTVLEAAPDPLASREPDAVMYLRGEIAAGRPWHEALLKAMGMWTLPRERCNGREYVYVIQGEALDWVLLAERLCKGIEGMIPPEELEDLLFRGRLPVEIGAREMKDALGYNKYRGLLNFWYGVVVEEALQLAVEDEVRKEMRASGRTDVEDLSDAVFLRLYDETRSSLLKRFRSEMKYSFRGAFSLTQAKELTYWLFKLRLKYWDPARVASDTHKGLRLLQQLRRTSSPI